MDGWMDGCCVLSLLSTTCTRPTAFLHHAASRVGNISRLIQLCGLGLVNCWAVFFRKTTTRFFRLSMCHFLALGLFAALDCRLYVFTFFRLLCLRSGGGGGGEGGREANCQGRNRRALPPNVITYPTSIDFAVLLIQANQRILSELLQVRL
jgi:hypothetical protein